MSTAQTLCEPKAERLRSNPVPQDIVEADEPELTMEEIVAICKES